MIGITGDAEKIKILARSWGAHHVEMAKMRLSLEEKDDSMDHTASVFLMNKEGHFVGSISHYAKSEEFLQKTII